MTELIGRLRSEVSDAAGADQVFTDDEVQRALDLHRTRLLYARLEPEMFIAPGGAVSYRDFLAPMGALEADAKVYSSAYAEVTFTDPGDTVDYMVGRFHKEAGLAPPLNLSAHSYDVHASAAVILDQWAARVKLEFDFATDGDRYQRSQKHQHLKDQAAAQRARGRLESVPIVRSDWA